MDEQLVLTAQTLRLNPDLRRADAAGEVFVVKNIPSRKYLTVSMEQWNLLRNFANPATVPDVLRAVILNRTCLPLREYYELVLKAHRAGVLQSQHQLHPQARAVRWFLSLNAWIPIFFTVLSLAAAIALLALRPFPLPGEWPQPALFNLLVEWVILAAALSLGQVLGAAVLKSGGGEIYEPRFRWLRPIPYFGVSFDDACMTTPLTQTGIWCARLFPVAASAAALWFYRPEWGALHVVTLLVMLRPFADGCMPAMLSTLCRGLVLDTQKNFLFSLNRRWKVRIKFGLSRLSIPYLAARLAWGLLWIVLVVFVALRVAKQSVRDVFGSSTYWMQVGMVFGAMAAVALIVYLGVPVARAGLVSLAAKWRQGRMTMRRWRAKTNEPVSPEQLARLMAESLLFRRIAPAERAELLQAGETKVFKAWSTMLKFSDRPTEVGIIVSGRVLGYRRTKSGRLEKAMYLTEGDVFGAHAVLDPDRQHMQLKALTPVIAVMVPMAEFERQVLRPLGSSIVHDLAHKVPFLRGVSFCSSWHPQAMARFAQLSSIISYNEGDAIVVERQDSQQFYIVYEGSVQVKRRGKNRGKLKPGAFFGEVGILQNSAAISDVIAREPTRCLTISKADFLRFVTHNPLVSLQLEEISSARLGRPIFPLSAHSFEVR
jgi:CRP-like cAMP-binding protein